MTAKRLAPLALLCVALACGGPNYTKMMTKKIVALLGDSFKHYQPFSYPTNNYGLATMYIVHGGGDRMDDRDFECDSWQCIGKQGSIPTDPAQELQMLGFAAVGGNGGTITLTESEQSQVALNVVLPQVYNILKIGGGYSKNSVVKTTLEIGRAWPRKLRRDPLLAYLTSEGAPARLKQAFNDGNLVIVVADVVIDRLRVAIEVEQNAKAALDAALTTAAPAVRLGQGADVDVKLSKDVTGKYVFDISRPVVISRLAKRQPSGGVLSADTQDAWADWGGVKAPLPQRAIH